MSVKTNELLCCPHCGSTMGFYRVTRMSGKGQWNYSFDGRDTAVNTEFYDSFTYVEQKKAFCIECDKEIRALRAT